MVGSRSHVQYSTIYFRRYPWALITRLHVCHCRDPWSLNPRGNITGRAHVCFGRCREEWGEGSQLGADFHLVFTYPVIDPIMLSYKVFYFYLINAQLFRLLNSSDSLNNNVEARLRRNICLGKSSNNDNNTVICFTQILIVLQSIILSVPKSSFCLMFKYYLSIFKQNCPLFHS